MARKTIADLQEGSQLWSGAKAELPKPKADRHAKSWCVVGIDSSMSSIAMAGIAHDDTLKKMTKVKYTDIRWTDADYFERIGDSARAHELVMAVVPIGLPLDRVFIFQEEPVPLGMMNSGRGARFQSGWIKQQCEISGALLGSLVKWGYKNIVQINNQQWKTVLRKEGVTIHKMPEGKFDVKKWAIQAFGLPDFPDLVMGPDNKKIPRPTEGKGARAKAVQPDDIYDAAAVMAYGIDFVQSREA
jgi:hypothetical protein